MYFLQEVSMWITENFILSELPSKATMPRILFNSFSLLARLKQTVITKKGRKGGK